MGARELSGDTFEDGPRVGLRLLERHAVRELCDRHHGRPRVVRRRTRRDTERGPELGVEERRRESLWHHAHDSEWLAVERYDAAHDQWIGAEAALPRTEAEDNELVLMGFFRLREDAAEHRLVSRHPQELRID